MQVYQKKMLIMLLVHAKLNEMLQKRAQVGKKTLQNFSKNSILLARCTEL